MTETTEFFTLEEVAEKLRLPYELVRDEVYAGRWPHTKFSPRNRRMSQADVDRVVEALHQEPATGTRSEARTRSKKIAALLGAV